MSELADRVEIEGNVTPDQVRDVLVDDVNLAWRQNGNDARCTVTANFVGWMIQENDRLRARVAELSLERDCLLEQVAVHKAGVVAQDMQEIMRINNEMLSRVAKLEDAGINAARQECGLLVDTAAPRGQSPAGAILEQIARMKVTPDDKINRFTLATAIKLASGAPR